MAWLSSGNQVGLEIFEYIEPKAQRRTTDNFEYWKSGFTHICITDPNIEDLCNRISERGGKQCHILVLDIRRNNTMYLAIEFFLKLTKPI
jgi:hypothetical protein